MVRYYVCYFHEILLKGKNRTFFEKRLYQNAQRALTGLPYSSMRRLSGRLVVELLPGSPVDEIGSRLQKVFGLVSCCPAWLSTQELGQLEADLWQLVRSRDFQTFKIAARRANKNYPLNSHQLNEHLGDVIRQRSGRRVQLENPDLTCYVDIVDGYVFLYFERLTGAKGLPVSTAGRVAVLLSGGIDSPVAAYKVMKRGCRAVFVHFHSVPYTTRESLDKVRRIVSVLNEYQYGSKIYMVPLAELQKQIVAFTPVETRVILYRRFMMRLAEQIARRERAQALVTGESIGQVASQTLENLRAISDAAQLPILRPLIGEDKEDIIAMARRIGTYPISILPDVDCCTLFMPKHPATRARLRGIRKVETELEVDSLVRNTLDRLEVEQIPSSFSKLPAPSCIY